MVETFCSCAIQTYLWRSLGIDIIFAFLSALFRLNNPISCSPSFQLIQGLLYFSNQRNTEYERSVRNTKTLNQSLETDDHRQKQPEIFKLKSNGFFFSSFLFATIQVVFIALEGNGSRAVQL